MAFGDSDLPAFFGDFGVDVAFNGVTVLGLMDNPVAIKMADRGFGGFETQMPALRLPYNAFTVMPVETDQMTIASAPALRARSMSGVMSGWVASILAL